jgi:hypothetical protein
MEHIIGQTRVFTASISPFTPFLGFAAVALSTRSHEAELNQLKINVILLIAYWSGRLA